MLARHLLILLFITSPMFFSEISFGDPPVDFGLTKTAYRPFPGNNVIYYFHRTDLSKPATLNDAKRGAVELQSLGTETVKNALTNLNQLNDIENEQIKKINKLVTDLKKENEKDPLSAQNIVDLEKKIAEYTELLNKTNPKIKKTFDDQLTNGKDMLLQAKQQTDALESTAGIAAVSSPSAPSSSSPSKPRLTEKDLPKNGKWQVSSDGQTGQFTNAAGTYDHPLPNDYQNALDAYKKNPSSQTSEEVMKQVRDLRQYNKATENYDQWVGGGATGNGQFQHAFGTPGQPPSMVWDNGVGGTGSPSVRDFNAASGSSGSASDYSWFRRPVSNTSVSSLSAIDVYRTPFSTEQAALDQARATFPATKTSYAGAIGDSVRLQVPTKTDSNYYIVPRQFAATNRGIASSSTVPGTGLNTAPRCIPSGACITVAW